MIVIATSDKGGTGRSVTGSNVAYRRALQGGDVCYVLTMHPQVIGRHHRMAMLERVVKYILEHDHVWFATGADIARHWAAHHPPPVAA